jgi:hypothetical protein
MADHELRTPRLAGHTRTVWFSSRWQEAAMALEDNTIELRCERSTDPVILIGHEEPAHRCILPDGKTVV